MRKRELVFEERFYRPSQGVVVPTLAITIPVVLIVIAFVATILNQRNITSNLQTLADIASKAGATAACSTKECFSDSRLLAMNVVEKQFLGTTGTLTRDDTISSWDIGDNTITIERGRWINGRGFEAFENSWQASHPGFPAFAGYNAVRVQIRRNNILSIFPALLKGSLISQVQATAVAKSPTTTENIPPFAIPICSLLNEQGNFDKKTVCDADRLFTESNHYCPAANPNCDVVPDFSYSTYTTYTSEVGENTIPRIYHNDPNVIPQSFPNGIGLGILGCSYFPQHFTRPSQNYGVVGMSVSPGSSSVVTDAQIEAILHNVDGKQHGVAIGDPFAVLDSGLTSIDAGIRISDLQDNPLGNRSEYEDFRSHDWAIINFVNMVFMGMPQRGGCDDTYISGIARRTSYGVCRSTRNHWGRPTSASDQMWSRYLNVIGMNEPYLPNRGLFNPKAKWRVRIPVIAETGPHARPCLGMNGNTTDDPNPGYRASDSTYEIIGFVTTYIYDSDIGEGPAEMPLLNNCQTADNQLQRVIESTMIGVACSLGGIQNVQEDATHLFGFHPDPLGPEQSCNVVRSRLDCDTSLFPSAEDRYQNDPYLVN